MKYNAPTDICGVLVEEDLASDAASDPGCGGEDHDSQRNHDTDVDGDDLQRDDIARKVPEGEYPTVVDVMCGLPPSAVPLDTFLGVPPNIHGKGAEAKYANDYFRCAPIEFDGVSKEPLVSRRMLPLEEHVTNASADVVNAMGLQQEDYFVRVDAIDLDSVPDVGLE